MASNAAYAEPGFLVFQRGSSVYAQPFDAKTSQVAGEPTRIADEALGRGAEEETGTL